MKKKEPFISIVSPVYNAEKIVGELVRRIQLEIEKITQNYEIILVEDSSKDKSWDAICKEGTTNKKIKGVKFSRNFGQHFAISAGIDCAKGDFIIVMDCDLQHDPKYFSLLYQKAKEGNDIVYTYVRKRKHSFVKNLFAKLFNLVFNYLSETVSSHYNVGSFSIISRKVADEFRKLKDHHRHYLLILRWLGFTFTFLEIEHHIRASGKSSYSIKKLINHAIDGITSQSFRLLRFSITVGFFYFLLSILASFYLIIMKFLYGSQPGWASLAVLLLLSTGLILMAVGISSIYIGNIFDQTRDRPLYIISDRINL